MSLRPHTAKVYRCIKEIRRNNSTEKAIISTCRKYGLKETNIRKIGNFKVKVYDKI